MKKHIISILSLVVLFGVLVSCADKRLDGMADDTVYLVKHDFIQSEMMYNNRPTSIFQVPIYKSGYKGNSADVELVVDEAVLEKYNEENGTSYKLLPATSYSIPISTHRFAEDQERVIIDVNFDVQNLLDVQGEEVSEYILPLKVISKNNVIINDLLGSLLLAPIADNACLSFTPFANNTSYNMIEATPIDNDLVYKLKVKTNNNNIDDLTFDIVADPSLLESYDVGTAKLVSQQAYSFNKEEFSLPAGTNEKEISLTIKVNEFVKDGVWPLGKHVIPLRINKVSQHYLDKTESIQLFKLEVVSPELDRTGWEVIDWNTSIVDDKEYADDPNLGIQTPDKILDGNEDTRWMAKWNDPLTPLPYRLVVDMKEEYMIDKILLSAPTHIDWWRGLWKGGYFEVSLDNKTWTKVLDWNLGGARPGKNEFRLNTSTKARYIRLMITEGLEYGDGTDPSKGPEAGTRMEISEFRVWGYK